MLTCTHDPEYIEARDRLIPVADSYAKELAIPRPYGHGNDWDGGYSKLFADKMQQLAMERGLTYGMPHQREALL